MGRPWWVIVAIVGCGPRLPAGPVQPSDDLVAAMERFVAFTLEPAAIPPPSVTHRWVEARGDGVAGRARVLAVEDASWNRWPGRELRLFNKRWAWVVEVRLDGPEALRWVPGRTTLELNDVSHVLPAAPTADDVMGDLLFWALQQERAALGDTLVARTRAAGPFRAAYLGPVDGGRGWSGLVAFPLVEVAELHVVAARLTMGLDDGGQDSDLVWVFE